MSERKFNPRHTAMALGTAIGIGGAVAAGIGGYRALSEYGDDKEARGAITRGLELDPKIGRPTLEKREEAVQSVKNLVSGIDTPSDEPEAYAVAGKLISSQSELEKQYKTLSQEQKFQDVRHAYIKAVGADNLDDANIWTLVAGSSTVLMGAGILGVSYKPRAEKEKGHHVEVSHDE